jgi:hypothetical protein
MSRQTAALTSGTHKNFESLDDLMKFNKPVIITSILLINQNLNNDAMKIIGNWIKNNTMLTNFNLTKNKISGIGASLLAEALMVNTSLTTLDLSNNHIGNSGVNAFFKMLQTNNTITSLYFDGNHITDTGIVSLENNTSLKKLNLRNNKIDNAGMISLVESIKLNRGLITLDLSYNIIGDSGDAFKTLFEDNSTLINLYMCPVNITQGVFDAFIDILNMTSCALKHLSILGSNLDSTINFDVHFNYHKLIDSIKYNTTLQGFLFSTIGVDSDLGYLLSKTIEEVLERNKLIENNIYPLMCCFKRLRMHLPNEIWAKVATLYF